MNKLSQTEIIINTVRKETGRVVLFYSCGKDSIVLIDMLAKKFDHIICYFMYFVEDLDHINSYLKWAEKKYPNIEIRQIPHFILSNIHKSGIYCEPEPKTKLIKIKDVEAQIRKEAGLKYIFSGMKGVDGFMKRMVLKKYEMNAISPQGTIYPLALWSNKEVLQYIKFKNLPQPIKYANKVSNGITFDIDVFLYLRNHYPNDLTKILKQYPLAESILFEYDRKQTTGVPAE